ncbi:glycosyltransferase family 2 protein [Phenylobacterium sp.]|uniref:glycosyltransferase family 2 protein n=1 Tax=Phenylobacterium sp. TaxID=1871053 RepID=UPI0025E8DC3B|nr:glycosyltransferase family 2 protein [Phenylobacterium sp.]
MSSSSHVAVVIIGFRNPGDIETCLASLALSTHADFTVYICENGGNEAYRLLTATAPDRLPGGQAVVTLNPGDNLGYAGGINHCIEAARGAYRAVWILNPDTEPQPDAMAALLRRLDRGDVEAVGGVMVSTNGQVQGYGGRWRPWLAIGGSIGLFARVDDPVDPAQIEAEQAYLIGASMLVSRRFIEQVGPMRADYFLYVEEVEWCLRARRKGFRLGFAPDAIVRHHQGTTTGWAGPFHQRPKLSIYLDARNRVRLTRQMNPWFLPTAVTGILLHSVWRYARRGAWRQVGYVFEGVAAGLRDESGRPSWAG